MSASDGSKTPIILGVIGTIVTVGSIIATAVYTFFFQGLPYIVVPEKYAALTTQQLTIRKLALRYGPGSGIYYIWGGTTPRGFDCSGYVGYILRTGAGVSIPRTTYSQWVSGKSVAAGDLRLGDAVYFTGSAGSYGSPGHVGLYIGNGEVIDYYSSGRPARRALLSSYYGFVGAKRWITLPAVPKRDFGTSVFIANRWQVKIASSKKDEIIFKATTTGGRFSLTKWKQLIKWSKATHHHYQGNRSSYLGITLWPRYKAPIVKTHWQEIASIAYWVSHHWGPRIKTHTASGIVTYIPAKGRTTFRVTTRAAIVKWAHQQGHATSGTNTYLKIALWPKHPHTD